MSINCEHEEQKKYRSTTTYLLIMIFYNNKGHTKYIFIEMVWHGHRNSEKKF